MRHASIRHVPGMTRLGVEFKNGVWHFRLGRWHRIRRDQSSKRVLESRESAISFKAAYLFSPFFNEIVLYFLRYNHSGLGRWGSFGVGRTTALVSHTVNALQSNGSP